MNKKRIQQVLPVISSLHEMVVPENPKPELAQLNMSPYPDSKLWNIFPRAGGSGLPPDLTSQPTLATHARFFPPWVSDSPEIRTHCFSVSLKRIKNVVKSSPEADLRQKDERKRMKPPTEDKVVVVGEKVSPGPSFQRPESTSGHCARDYRPCRPNDGNQWASDFGSRGRTCSRKSPRDILMSWLAIPASLGCVQLSSGSQLSSALLAHRVWKKQEKGRVGRGWLRERAVGSEIPRG